MKIKIHFVWLSFVVSLLIMGVMGYMFLTTSKKVSLHQLTIGKNTINVEYAVTAAELARGLSGRTALAEDTGMLFLFDEPSRHIFWMKDMKFPLDFIWIRNHQAVQVNENVPPPGQDIPRVVPQCDVDAVLEVNAGWVTDHHVKIGDEVKY